MKLHTLKPNKGAKHRVKRLGCGESSGHGKTCRQGPQGPEGPLRRRHPPRLRRRPDAPSPPSSQEGIQQRRLPTTVVGRQSSRNSTTASTTVPRSTRRSLRETGLVKGRCDKVKVLGNGELSKKLTIAVDAVSASAREKIEKAGGTRRAACCRVSRSHRP